MKGTKSYLFCNLIGITNLSITFTLFNCFKSVCVQRINKIIGIDNSSFAALHTSTWKIYHSITQMEKFICPFKAQFLKNMKENLKMIILFACYNIYKLVKCPVVVAADCSTDVLSDVYTGSVFAEQNFFLIIAVLTLA